MNAPAAEERLPQPAPSKWEFDTFLSYSTGADYKFALRLEEFLEGFHGEPGIRQHHLKPLKVCVDGSDFTLPAKSGRTLSKVENGSGAKSIVSHYLRQCASLIVLWPGPEKATPFMEWELEEFLRQNAELGWTRPIRLMVTHGEDPGGNQAAFFSRQQISANLHSEIFYDGRGAANHPPDTWRKVRDFERERMRLAVDLRQPVDETGKYLSADDLFPGWQRAQLKAKLHRRNVWIVALLLLSVLTVTAMFERSRAQLGRALAFTASATSQFNDKVYLAARATMGKALLLNDASIVREMLATATLHSPTLLYSVPVTNGLEFAATKGVSHRRMVYCSEDDSILLVTRTALLKLDARTGARLNLQALDESDWCLATAGPNSGAAFLGGTAGKLLRIRTKDLSVLQEHRVDAKVFSLAISPDERIVAVGAEDGLHFLDSSDLSKPNGTDITSHAYSVNAVCFAEKIGLIWAAETRVFLTRFDEKQKTDIAFSDTEAVLAVAYDSGSVCFGGEGQIVYFETPKRRYKMAGHRSDVVDIAISFDGQYVVSLAADGEIVIWRTRSGTLLSRFSLCDKQSIAMCLVGTNGDLALLTADGYLCRFAANPNLLPEFLVGPTGKGSPIFEHLFAVNGRCVAVNNYGTVVSAESASRTATTLYKLDGSGLGVGRIALSPDHTLWASFGYYSEAVSVHSFKDGKKVAECPIGPARAFTWTAGNHLVLQSTNTELRVLVLTNGALADQRKLPIASANDVSHLVSSPDYRKLAVILKEGVITALDWNSGTPILRASVHGPVTSAAVNDRGEVAACSRGKAYLFKTTTGELLLGDGVAVAFSPSGRLVAAGDDQRNIIGIYSTDSGELVCRLLAHTTPIWAIAFVTEHEVWTSEFDDCVRVWNIAPALQAEKESRKQVAADARRQTGLDAVFRQGHVELIAVGTLK